jgi:DNA-binding NtrC family response regulator
MARRVARILIVDDEFSVRDSLLQWFRQDGYDVEVAEDAAAGLHAIERGPFDVVLTDIKMPGMDGLELQERIHAVDPRVAVIMITAFASVETAIRALKQGAFDYVTKPVDPDELSHLVRKALSQRELQDENVKLRETIEHLNPLQTIVGDSPGMRQVAEHVRRVAETDATVLIRGESGTGKELVARAIHALGPRRYFPIVPVNCGAMPESLLESEIFGHEKGAFTGAQFRRKGRLEMADQGTLFLDEIGTIGMKMQVDLLRVLETKELMRVGGSRPVKVDFRVICSTNEDLEAAVKAGRFREDLYYRINVFSIVVPPLRERPSDIPLLARHFLERLSAQMDRRYTDLAPDALERLAGHSWPGNVRELANAIERAMVVGRPPLIHARDLPILEAPTEAEGPSGESLQDMERHHIRRVLARTGWNVTRAAEILDIDRVTLYNKIRKYGLERPAETGSPGPR